MVRLAILYAFMGISLHVTCSAQEADRIYFSLNKKPDNFLKVKELAAAANSLASNNPAEAVKLAKYIISLSVKLGNAEGLAIGYNELGNAFERHSVYDSAFKYFFTSNRIFTEINNPEGRANTMIDMGNTHEIMVGFIIGNKYGDTCPRNVW